MALPPIPRSAVATLVALVVLLLLLARSSPSPAAPPAPNLPPTHKDGHDSQRPAYSKQIIALGDLHGSLSSAKRVLRMAGVIDVDGKWVLGNGTLVQSGDIVDRGTDTIALYRFFEELRIDAHEKGGKVESLLGNHEVMNALGDWRYVTPDDIATFGDIAERRAEFAPDGSIGRTWLANYSLTAKIPLHPLTSTSLDSTASISVIHAGLPFNTPKSTLLPYPSRINELAKSFLYKALLEEAAPYPPGPWPGVPDSMTSQEAALWDGQGVWWYRGYALNDELAACAEAKQMTDRLGVRRLVMGHTPNFEGMVSRCNGTILLIDTGISPAYNGEMTALSIKTTLYPHSSSDDKKHKDLRRRSYPPQGQAPFNATLPPSSSSNDDVSAEVQSALGEGEPSWLEVETIEELRLPNRGEGVAEGDEWKAQERRWMAGGERVLKGRL